MRSYSEADRRQIRSHHRNDPDDKSRRNRVVQEVIRNQTAWKYFW